MNQYNGKYSKKFFLSVTHMITPAKFNVALEHFPSQKERIVFQPSFFRGDLLNFRGGMFAFLIQQFSTVWGAS